MCVCVLESGVTVFKHRMFVLDVKKSEYLSDGATVAIVTDQNQEWLGQISALGLATFSPQGETS